jgi:hypothetical protein
VVLYSNPYTTKAVALVTALDLARKAAGLLQRAGIGVPPTTITG